MCSARLEIISEGASPLYADYDFTDNFGKDVSSVLEDGINDSVYNTEDFCRFYFYFRVLLLIKIDS